LTKLLQAFIHVHLHGMSLGCGWGTWLPDVEDNWK